MMPGIWDVVLSALERGVTIRRNGNRLIIEPKSLLRPDEIEALQAHGEELAAFVASGEIPRTSAGGAAQGGQPVPPPLRDWLSGSGKRDDEIQRARLRLEAVEEEIRDFARSRWGTEADRWPAPILAGLFARDLSAGLKAVLEPWPGWERVREEFDHPTGPELISAVWAAYGELQPEIRQRVMDAGDRFDSPPGNAPRETGAGHG